MYRRSFVKQICTNAFIRDDVVVYPRLPLAPTLSPANKRKKFIIRLSCNDNNNTNTNWLLHWQRDIQSQ